MAFEQCGATRSAVRHVAWTVLIAGSGLLISLFVPGIQVVFQLMGSTCSAFVCFILPAAFGLKLRLPEASGLLGFVACSALLFGGAAVGALATLSTISGLMSPAEDDTGAMQSHVCDRGTCHV